MSEIQPTYPTRIDLPLEVRGRMAGLLNQQLADLIDLRSQIKQAHWTIKGPHFYQLHLLFDALAGGVDDAADTVAERVAAVAHTPEGTARAAGRASRLPEYPLTALTGTAHLVALAVRVAACGATARAAIRTAADGGDETTADVFTELSRTLDKGLWMLEAHLQGDRSAVQLLGGAQPRLAAETP